METFRCQNPGCCKESDYSLTQIRARDSTVQCQHCQTIHRLEVTPGNHRAMALYERVGFRGKNRTMRRKI